MLLVIITIAQTATVSMLLVIIIWNFELDEGNFDAEAFSKDDGYINELDIKKTFDSDSHLIKLDSYLISDDLNSLWETWPDLYL